jgi:TetR/AcrR family transcriptional regulator, fatty acid metabolism regulator protein
MYQKYMKRKDRVIIDAIDLLDEQGIQGLTTKEIARREGISEPAIYKQFDSKKEIILAIMDKSSAFNVLISNTILEQKMSFFDALLYFTESITTYYQNYPQIITVMFSFDVFKYDPDTNSKMQKTVNDNYDFIKTLIKKGIETGELDSKTESEGLAEIIPGILWSAIWRWKITGCKYDLKETVMKSIKWIIRSI